MTESESLILTEVEAGICTITLNRPERLNALTSGMIQQFLDALKEAERDPAVSVIIIRGAGRAFCSGHDLSMVSRQSDDVPAGGDMVSGQHGQMRNWMTIWELDIPVISAVHGYALGAGFEIALHSDFIVATPDAQFGYPPVRATGYPDSQMFAYRMGVQWAKRVLFTGDNVDGATGEQIGMVLKTVEQDQLYEEALALARATQQVPLPFLHGLKRTLNSVIERQGLEETARQARYEFALTVDHPDIQEFGRIMREQGVKAAIEWRQSR